MALAPLSQTIFLTEDGSTPIDPSPVNIPSAVPGLPVSIMTSAAIASDGTPQVGETLTGIDPVFSNGQISRRRWLSGASALASTAAYIPSAAGTVRWSVDILGNDGVTVESGSTITVAAATPVPTPTPTPPSSGTLNALTLTNTSGTMGQAFTSTVGNGYAGSAYLRTLAVTAPAGLSASGSTVSGTPTQAASAIVLVEALYETAGDASTITIAQATGRVVASGPATIVEGNAVAIISVTGPANIVEGNPSGFVSATGPATITEGN